MNPAISPLASASASHPSTSPAEPAGAYRATRHAASHWHKLRELNYHVLQWGPSYQASANNLQAAVPKQPPIVMLHGWMDVAASFQFVADALGATALAGRTLIAPDWRGYGGTKAPAGTDSYWFPDYVADLDALLEHISPDAPVDLLGHSMGGNVAMMYAGTRPQRIRKLVNLEGFGLPRTEPEQAAPRMAEWLESLRSPARMLPFANLDAVVARLMKNNPRLPLANAQWLAPHWAEALPNGSYHVRADPAHKRPNPMLYRVEEYLALWRNISAPLLWVEADGSEPEQWWGKRYSKREFHERLNVVPNARRETVQGAGHMLHHDQPKQVAALLADFLRD